MAGTSKGKGKDVKSPQEIEEGIKSIPTVTCYPFTVLPKEIYLIIFDMLERAEDKHNFMNAHTKWHDLFKSKRVLFLFGKVFHEVVKNDDGKDEVQAPECVYYKHFKRYHHCRLVCHDWDVGVQEYFQLHEYYFSLNGRDDIKPPYSALRTVILKDPCQCPMFFLKDEVDKQLEEYSVTHPPSKNPIFSRSIILLPFWHDSESPEEVQRYRASLDTLLEIYGEHIWHCKIDIDERLNPEACICIGKWISLMPELKTLELTSEEEFEPLCRDLKEIQDTQLIRLDMKKLVFLKSFCLPAVFFNKLFGNIPLLEKIQIEMLTGKESFLRDFELMIEKEKLEEACLTLKGYEDLEYLKSSQPFPSLKKLVLQLEFETKEEWKNKAYSNFPEWKMIFGILEEKFQALDELTLILPKAVCMKNKKVIIQQSLGCRLNLPNLKRLWVALPNLCSIDFLEECKELQELHLVLEHSAWNFQSSGDLSRREEINFNVDLSKMWESNIWTKFSELRKLKIKAWRDFGRSDMPWMDDYTFDIYTYETSGEKRSYSECKAKSKQF